MVEDSTRLGTEHTRTRESNAYDAIFEQVLVDNGVHMPARAPPRNIREIQEALAQPRASLSPTLFSEEDCDNLQDVYVNANDEEQVMERVVPKITREATITGEARTTGARKVIYCNLDPMIEDVTTPVPDLYYGCVADEIAPPIRKELSKHIVPSMTTPKAPLLPNCFMEVKGPKGTQAVVVRQATYDGVIGARAMHTLRSHKRDKVYDGNAYTITSTLCACSLMLYSVHLIQSEQVGGCDYILHPLGGWNLLGDHQTLRRGVAAFRNARDWAKRQRDEAIKLANEAELGSQAAYLANDESQGSILPITGGSLPSDSRNEGAPLNGIPEPSHPEGSELKDSVQHALPAANGDFIKDPCLGLSQDCSMTDASIVTSVEPGALPINDLQPTGLAEEHPALKPSAARQTRGRRRPGMHPRISTAMRPGLQARPSNLLTRSAGIGKVKLVRTRK